MPYDDRLNSQSLGNVIMPSPGIWNLLSGSLPHSESSKILPKPLGRPDGRPLLWCRSRSVGRGETDRRINNTHIPECMPAPTLASHEHHPPLNLTVKPHSIPSLQTFWRVCWVVRPRCELYLRHDFWEHQTATVQYSSVIHWLPLISLRLHCAGFLLVR